MLKNKMQERVLIEFTHIPKCGGTSFRKGLESSYGKGLFPYYQTVITHNPSARLSYKLWRIKNRLFQLKTDIPAEAKIIYGHYCLDDIYVEKSIKILRGAFFRDPIEWIGSLYIYSKNKYSNEIPRDPLTYIDQLNLKNGYKKFLGNVKVSSLDFVGIVEDYSQSLQLYESIFSVKIPLFYERKTDKPDSAKNSYYNYFASIGLLPEIKKRMKKNTEIYKRAIVRYNEIASLNGMIEFTADEKKE